MVVLQALNSISFAVAIPGILRTDLSVTNVDPLYTHHKMRHQLTDSQAKAIVYTDVLAETAQKAIKGLGISTLIAIFITNFFPWPRREVLSASLRYLKKRFRKPIFVLFCSWMRLRGVVKLDPVLRVTLRVRALSTSIPAVYGHPNTEG